MPPLRHPESCSLFVFGLALPVMPEFMQGSSASSKPTLIRTARLSRVKAPSSAARRYRFGRVCSYVAGHDNAGVVTVMTGHIGANTPRSVPPRWGRQRFDPTEPTQTWLCKFGWVWSSLRISSAEIAGILSPTQQPCAGCCIHASIHRPAQSLRRDASRHHSQSYLAPVRSAHLIDRFLAFLPSSGDHSKDCKHNAIPPFQRFQTAIREMETDMAFLKNRIS